MTLVIVSNWRYRPRSLSSVFFIIRRAIKRILSISYFKPINQAAAITVHRIAQALGVTVEDLLEIEY